MKSKNFDSFFLPHNKKATFSVASFIVEHLFRIKNNLLMFSKLSYPFYKQPYPFGQPR